MTTSSFRLLPAASPSEVFGDLKHAAAKSDSVRAAMAYWTIGPDFVPGVLVEKLRPPGFLCVDLHWPTNVDHLAALHDDGAAVFLHLDHPGAGVEPEAGREGSMPDALLHTKLWLFDGRDDSEAWVGSHNFTRRAMMGINFEATLAGRLGRDERLYRDLDTYMTEIRGACQPFDPDLIDYYKWLQGERERTVPVVTMRGADLLGLDGQRILLLSTEGVSAAELGNLGHTVHVLAMEDGQHDDRVYEGIITKVGDVSREDRARESLVFRRMRMGWLRPTSYCELEASRVLTARDEPELSGYAELLLSRSALSPRDLLEPPEARKRWPSRGRGNQRVGALELLPDRRPSRAFVVGPAEPDEVGFRDLAMAVRSETHGAERQSPIRRAIVRSRSS